MTSKLMAMKSKAKSTQGTLGGLVFEQKEIIEKESRIREIGNISEILGFIKDLGGKRVICGFDWDNTISMRNGCNVPLRDGNVTIETMDALNKMNVMWFIATSRYAGVNVEAPIIQKLLKQRMDELSSSGQGRTFNECVKTGVQEKYNALPPLAQQAQVGYAGLNPPDVTAIRLLDEKESPDTALIYGNVIYSGGRGKDFTSNKGRAFVKLMANGILPAANMFDVLIFVDNDLEHIKAVIKEFDNSGFGDKLLPIYYPQLPMTLPEDSSCGVVFDISNCLTGK